MKTQDNQHTERAGESVIEERLGELGLPGDKDGQWGVINV